MSGLVTASRPAERVMLLTLSRPEKLNALSISLLRELVAFLAEAEKDANIGCVVITGSGRAFSAGADIADQQKYGEDVPFNHRRLADWDAIQNFTKPLVAAVNGYALGGGNELAMLADVIIAAETARFGQPEIRIGIFPGDGGTQRLVRAVGKSRAMQMILTGEPIDAETALRAGLVSEVVPGDRLQERAVEIARVIAGHSSVALRTAKKAVLQAFEISLADGLKVEREIFREPFASEERREGMAAFLERRPARFHDH
jgi:enoyl-CoA hydratase